MRKIPARTRDHCRAVCGYLDRLPVARGHMAPKPGSCGCVTCDEDALGCAGPANPEVIAAVKKRYPKADADAWAFDETTKNGKRRYSVTFFNDDGNHISCKLKLKPTRLGRCGIIHA